MKLTRKNSKEELLWAVESYNRRIRDLEAQLAAAKNLLAVIHRDGGHHTDAVGLVQSCQDAQAKVPALGGEVVMPKRNPEITRLKNQNDILRQAVVDLHWMARRYADGSRTYATSMFNERTRQLLRIGVKLDPKADYIIWARDGMGRKFDGLTDAEATPGTPEAKGEVVNDRD